MDKSVDKKSSSIAEILGLASFKYDIFCSYCHSDNDTGLINRFLKKLAQTYRALSGEQLNIFIDRTEIITADLWESKILEALYHSRLLLALLSPSYFKSEWCVKEWLYAEQVEYKISIMLRTPRTTGTIAPVLIYSLDRARFSDEQKLLVKKARERQWTDISTIKTNNLRFQQAMQGLVEDLIDQLDAQNAIIPNKKDEDVGTIVVDSKTGLIWSGSVPLVQMTIEEAKEYVSNLDLADYKDWRLPTKGELESLIDSTLLSTDPSASPVPLRPPFNSPRFGYLHSSTPVIDNAGHFIMHIRNGHIFNGYGYRAFVRAVRGKSNIKQ
jgi:Protein of unknown function (DUF1566)/TIR domain